MRYVNTHMSIKRIKINNNNNNRTCCKITITVMLQKQKKMYFKYFIQKIVHYCNDNEKKKTIYLIVM